MAKFSKSECPVYSRTRLNQLTTVHDNTAIMQSAITLTIQQS